MIVSMKASVDGIAKRDVAIAVVLSVLGALLMWGDVTDLDGAAMRTDPDERAAIHIGNVLPYEFAIPLFLLVTVPTAWRRVAPLPAIGVALAGLVANELLVGSELVRCGIVLPVAFLFAFAAAAYLTGRDAVAGLLGSIAITAVVALIELSTAMAGVFVPITTGFWAIGRVVRTQRTMGEELRRRTARLREARDERTRLEVSTDRVRLSRELDELLQRRLSQLARMADAGADAEDPDGAAAALARIEHESRRTLEDMRRAVGVLRDDTTAPEIAPLPSLTQLDALLVHAKGERARVAVEGNPRVLPPAVELSAYRVVEHLLSALEDTPDLGVTVRFTPGAVEIAVSGPARPRAKAAIERARERARLHSGTVEATVRGGRAEAFVSLPVVAVVPGP
jgi:signal transduction histidine kinase